MTNRYTSINQKLYLEEEAKISVNDLAIQRGFGIFDFLKTINHHPIFLENHLDRFFHSANKMNIPLSLSREELKHSISDLLNANKLANSGLKFILTGGYSADGYTLSTPNLIITQVPFEINPEQFNKGIKLVAYEHQRQLPEIKTIDYLQAIRLSSFIKESGADDVLYYSSDHLRECPRANIFVVKGHQIMTPKTNILKGITRSKILSLNLEGFEIVEQDIPLSLLPHIDEAFISSSTKNALPVLEIDGVTVGNGRPGEVTTWINKELQTLINEEQNR